ncbi:hypothetical protein Poly41_31300 [Novipirellula artificiosorum]|uniref:Uncharacterized protein n=1 Tax=Novipirellula artificiosorum TaxID=2528016 RepID=A0A5C6DMW7_9BACT|nr:hypothetical protein Poly41_31300 [Novipirellula artificiosorum]
MDGFVDRRMTAGEDHPQLIVFDWLAFAPRVGLFDRVESRHHVGRGLPKVITSSDVIDGLKASRRDEPRDRILGNSFNRPTIRRNRKRLLHRFFSEIQVTK